MESCLSLRLWWSFGCLSVLLLTVVIVVDDLVGKRSSGSRSSIGRSSGVQSVGIVGRHRWIVAVVSAVWWLRRWRWFFSRIVTSVVWVWRWFCHVSVT